MRNSVLRFAALAVAAGLIATTAGVQQAEAKHRAGHKAHARAHAQNIIAVAKANSSLSTFTKAVAAAGLTGTLEQAGPYTVFAPSNAAFGKMNQKRLADLLKDNKKLKQVLLYHVVKGKVTAADISNGQHALQTVEGEKLMTNVKDGKVEVGGALVSDPDKKASNGLIHVVDDVLTPPAVQF